MLSVATGGADPVGGSQSIRKIFRATGGGSRAKKVQFKRGIKPLFYFIRKGGALWQETEPTEAADV
jgi:hypothetical protein